MPYDPGEDIFDPISSNGGSDYAPGENPTPVNNYHPWDSGGYGPGDEEGPFTNPYGNWGGGPGGDGSDGSGPPNQNPNGGRQWWDDWTPDGSGGSGGTTTWPSDGSGDGSGPNWWEDPSIGMMAPAFAAAYKQWQDAGKYTETAKEAMKYGDPFGQANREKYQKMFSDTYEHPEQFLNDPGHLAKLKSGLDTVSRQDAMKGYLGSGTMAADLSAYTTNLNNQFLDQERQRLTPLMGAQFDPSKAGEFLMRGNDQSIASQNAALGSMMSVFGRKFGQDHIDNRTTVNNGNPNGNPNGSNPNGNKPWTSAGSNPYNTSSARDLIDAVNSGNRDVVNQAINSGIRFVKLPDGSTADLYAMARSGYRTGEDDDMGYPIRTDNGFPNTGDGEPGGSSEDIPVWNYDIGYGSPGFGGGSGYDPGNDWDF